jgi:hypothetical protein
VTDDDRPRFTIQGVQVPITAEDVLAATFRRDAPPVVAGSWWVLIRRKRVPARWVLTRTLAYLAEHRPGDPRPDRLNSRALQTRPAVRVLAALGFPTGQQP